MFFFSCRLQLFRAFPCSSENGGTAWNYQQVVVSNMFIVILIPKYFWEKRRSMWFRNIFPQGVGVQNQPSFISNFGHLEGVPHYLEDLQSPWLFHLTRMILQVHVLSRAMTWVTRLLPGSRGRLPPFKKIVKIIFGWWYKPQESCKKKVWKC